jgi:hypothetical protein
MFVFEGLLVNSSVSKLFRLFEGNVEMSRDGCSISFVSFNSNSNNLV